MQSHTRFLYLSLICILLTMGLSQCSRVDDSKRIIKWPEIMDTVKNRELVPLAGEQKYTQGDIISLGPRRYPQPKDQPFFISPTDKQAKEPIFSPAVGFDGNNYLVVWSDGYTLMGARVSPQGKVLDPAGFVINKNGYHLAPRLAYAQGNYLVVWETSGLQDMRNVRAALVSPQAKVSSIMLAKTSSNKGMVVMASGDPAKNSGGIPVFPDAPYHLNPYQDWDAL
jgi:hypothetical protein